MSKLSIVGKIVRLPLALIPKSLVVTFLSGPLKGFKWIVGASNHSYWLGFYEKRMKQLLLENLKAGDSMLDLGGHVGYYSLIGSRLVGSTGRVFTFEPLPRNIKFLEDHLRLNKVTNVRLYKGAIAEYEGTFKLNDSSPVGARLSETGGLDVRVYSLPKLWEEKELPIPQVIKMDIEGAERTLLPAIRSYLAQNNIKLFLSTHGKDTHRACVALLQELGYQFIPLDGATLDTCTEMYCYK